MSAAKQDERDWELEALASAISSFFKRRVGGEEGKALAGLTRELAARAGSGSSHLGSDQADEICENWASLPGVGSTDENLPLVHAYGKLYFRRFFEYEKQVAEALSRRISRPSVLASRGMIDFFRDSLKGEVDDQQALAWGRPSKRPPPPHRRTGTGKTRTIVAILAAYLQANPVCWLLWQHRLVRRLSE